MLLLVLQAAVTSIDGRARPSTAKGPGPRKRRYSTAHTAGPGSHMLCVFAGIQHIGDRLVCEDAARAIALVGDDPVVSHETRAMLARARRPGPVLRRFHALTGNESWDVRRPSDTRKRETLLASAEALALEPRLAAGHYWQGAPKRDQLPLSL